MPTSFQRINVMKNLPILLFMGILLTWVRPASAESSQSFELKASVKYAQTTDQYLMTYSSIETEGGPHIYGRLLKSDGSPAGKDFKISTQAGKATKPVLAYSARAQRFLVVWGRKSFGEDRAEIVGVSLSVNGGVAREEFRISESNLYDQRPSVAYCPGRDRFLVTWSRGFEYDADNGESDVYGQFVEGNGSHQQGGNFLIASGAKNQFKQDADCDTINDRFLVVWEDQRQASMKDDIYGQMISSDGQFIGKNFLIAGGTSIERRPVVASNGKDGTYIVVWESEIEGTGVRIFSQAIDVNGVLQGTPVPIGSELGGDRNRAALAYLPKQNVFLVVFDNSPFDSLSDGIYGQFLAGNGKLRQGAIPLTTAKNGQYRPDVAASVNTFLVVWTDYRGVSDKGGVYEYYGRIVGNDMPLSARSKNPDSR